MLPSLDPEANTWPSHGRKLTDLRLHLCCLNVARHLAVLMSQRAADWSPDAVTKRGSVYDQATSKIALLWADQSIKTQYYILELKKDAMKPNMKWSLVYNQILLISNSGLSQCGYLKKQLWHLNLFWLGTRSMNVWGYRTILYRRQLYRDAYPVCLLPQYRKKVLRNAPLSLWKRWYCWIYSELR